MEGTTGLVVIALIGFVVGLFMYRRSNFTLLNLVTNYLASMIGLMVGSLVVQDPIDATNFVYPIGYTIGTWLGSEIIHLIHHRDNGR